MFLLRLEQTINAFSDWLGKISAVLFVIMLFNVFYDVITRYLFNDVSIGMQELEWHLFAVHVHAWGAVYPEGRWPCAR